MSSFPFVFFFFPLESFVVLLVEEEEDELFCGKEGEEFFCFLFLVEDEDEPERFNVLYFLRENTILEPKFSHLIMALYVACAFGR